MPRALSVRPARFIALRRPCPDAGFYHDRWRSVDQSGSAVLNTPDNNAAERAMKPAVPGRKDFLLVGSEGVGKSAVIAYTLIETALCRARHRAVYAERRTMPNGLVFPRIHRERRWIGSA